MRSLCCTTPLALGTRCTVSSRATWQILAAALEGQILARVGVYRLKKEHGAGEAVPEHRSDFFALDTGRGSVASTRDDAREASHWVRDDATIKQTRQPRRQRSR
ncbi:hypothetical protein THAOC_06021 [Thalassiosira oceanica]|uniref:Uncharacterized protein n=1 Tax=Thalassiosira oceanica TaxID=159749 RepID=K0T5N3_THAOC|nr:hypothetical protein THAOC_06021 [Thalassiosira oceanica]|eukprot:EJK72449.1 hypothetical protein THAOC_06021 [Thalassiosira oceanica]